MKVFIHLPHSHGENRKVVHMSVCVLVFFSLHNFYLQIKCESHYDFSALDTLVEDTLTPVVNLEYIVSCSVHDMNR